MAQFIQVHVENQVATVKLARPELHNAFNDQMIAELADAFSQLGQQSNVRAIILAAESKSFCAGADLNWMRSMLDYSLEENIADARKLAEMLRTIQECPKPVIGRIHGAAFGGGVGLTSVCDIAIAVESATFCLSEVKLGLLPAVISPFVLQKMPASQARRYFLTAERFSAKEALRTGLVSAVVADEAELDATIQSIITSIKQNGPEAVSLCKSLIFDVDGLPMDEAITLTTRRIAERRISAEGQEGMRAFLEKRPSQWIPVERESGVS